VATAPDVPVWNPAFDVTPARYISAFITDAGILRPPFEQAIAAALGP
jgi:methylthioribose-1-phosphate isomerase